VIREGQPAPDFDLTSDDGKRVKLSDFRGSVVVLYFYPKDDTTGCTTQACGMRDHYDAFRERDAVVLGVSPDDEDSHADFKQKYGLPFKLLADTELEVTKAYGVLRDDAPYPERATFVIGEDGAVKRVFRKVDPDTHADEVLAALDA